MRMLHDVTIVRVVTIMVPPHQVSPSGTTSPV